MRTSHMRVMTYITSEPAILILTSFQPLDNLIDFLCWQLIV
jgi:hypothetical protein